MLIVRNDTVSAVMRALYMDKVSCCCVATTVCVLCVSVTPRSCVEKGRKKCGEGNNDVVTENVKVTQEHAPNA